MFYVAPWIITDCVTAYDNCTAYESRKRFSQSVLLRKNKHLDCTFGPSVLNRMFKFSWYGIAEVATYSRK